MAETNVSNNPLSSDAMTLYNSVMNDYKGNFSEAELTEFKSNFPSEVDAIDQMRTNAFGNAAGNLTDEIGELDNKALALDMKVSDSTLWLNAIRQGNYGFMTGDKYNEIKELGHLDDVKDKNGNIKDKGLRTLYDECNDLDQRTVYAEQLEKLEAYETKYADIQSQSNYDMQKCYDEQSLLKAEQDLYRTMAGGINGAEQVSAVNEAMASYNSQKTSFDNKYSQNADVKNEVQSENTVAEELKPLDVSEKAAVTASTVIGTEAVVKKELTADEIRAQGINSEADALRLQEALKNEEKTFETKTVETKDYAASSDTSDEMIESDEKPNPYAFEKPACPSGMPSDAYAKMCEMQEQQHIKEVNEKVADEIWTKGNWGNGQERINKLTAAGYDVAGVQAVINDKVTKLNEASANKVILVPNETVQEKPKTINKFIRNELSSSVSAPIMERNMKPVENKQPLNVIPTVTEQIKQVEPTDTVEITVVDEPVVDNNKSEDKQTSKKVDSSRFDKAINLANGNEGSYKNAGYSADCD